MIEEMYKENILEHYKNPSNSGKLKEYTHSARELNPVCGDEISIFLNLNDGVVKDVGFIGQGCAISQASCSMLTEKIKGMRVDDVKRISSQDMIKMLGITISYVRMKCALLSLYALNSAIN